jgi:hypothetical protein
VNSFYDLGYATGLSEHWRSNPNAMYKFASKILFATSFEEAHFVIGDYFAIGKDGKLYKHEFENSRRREKAA